MRLALDSTANGRDNIYDITIKASDAAGNESTAQAFKIKVKDVDDEKPVYSGAGAVLTVDENLSTATAINWGSFTDNVTSSCVFTYTLDGTDQDYFALTNGVLTFKASPDYETKSSYNITITARAAGNEQRSAPRRDGTITVNNHDDEKHRFIPSGTGAALTGTATRIGIYGNRH